MNKLLIVSLLVFVAPAFADSSSVSHLHWPGIKCKVEDNDKMESTPQSPPLVVDDPATPGCNHWEINIVLSSDNTFDEKHLELPLLDINYGVGDDLQLKYEVPNVTEQTDEGSATAVGDSKVGVKYLFFEDEEINLQMAIYPQMEFAKSENNHVTTLPFLLSKKLGETAAGDVMITGNIGYNTTTKVGDSNFLSSSVGVGAPVSSKISVMGELATEKAFADNSSGVREELTRANLGIMTSIFKRVLIFGSVGQSLYASDGQSHTYFLAGIRL